MISRFIVRLRGPIGLLLLTLLPISAAGNEVWTITGADFSDRRAAITRIDDAGVHQQDSDGQATITPWQQVLEISRSQGRAGIPNGAWAVWMSNGDRLLGEPVRLEGESLVWSSPLGEATVPLRQVRAIALGMPEFDLDETLPEDRLQLANGDVVTGVVESLSAGGAVMSGSGEVGWDAISALRFAGVQPPAAAGGRSFRVHLVGGSILTARSIKAEGAQFDLTLSDGTTSQRSAGSILTIEQLNGPVMWLADLRPAKSLQQPYFATDAPPARTNLSSAGDPIRDGDRTARCGIGVASYSRITWNLPGGHAAFRARYAIDGALPYANVTVRILLDGKVAYEKQDVTAGTPVQAVMVPLGDAKTIALEVDYGKTYDVQDRLNWIEPALVTTPPTTRPAD